MSDVIDCMSICVLFKISMKLVSYMSKILYLHALPNQELSALSGGPTLNYGRQLSLYFPHKLRVNMTRDLAHLQMSDLQGEIIYMPNVWFTGRKSPYTLNVKTIIPL